MFDEKELEALRRAVGEGLSDFRYAHILGVEKEAARLGELFAPEKIQTLRAAALLHDVTKELSFENQLQICEKNGIIISYSQKMTPKVLHAMTAAAIIPEKYPLFNEKEVIDAVRWHTTGRADMSICEKLIFLADYIEENRKFEDCIMIRDLFYGACPEKMTYKERLGHLNDTIIASLDVTIKSLTDEERPIDICTVEARNFLICEKGMNGTVRVGG